MTKDTLATCAGIAVAIASTFQTMAPPETPWYVRATLASIAAALGLWTGVKAYKLPPRGEGHIPSPSPRKE